MTLTSQSANVGTVRTGWNTTIVLGIAALVSRYTDVDLDIEDPIVVGVLGGAVVVFYRLSRVVADRWKWVGYVLYGTPRTPGYALEPPAPPPPPQ